jgi:hypothetical protein
MAAGAAAAAAETQLRALYGDKPPEESKEAIEKQVDHGHQQHLHIIVIIIIIISTHLQHRPDSAPQQQTGLKQHCRHHFTSI